MAKNEKSVPSRNLFEIFLESKKSMQSNDPEKGYNGITMLIVGGSNRGKTTLLTELLSRVYSDDLRIAGKQYLTCLFTESSQSDALKKLEKQKNVVIVPGMDLDIISFFYNQNMTYGKTKVGYSPIIVMDDILELRYESVIQKLFCIYRNMNITSIVSVQHANLIPRSIRGSVYYQIIFPSNNAANNEDVCRAFLWSYLEGRNVVEKMKSFFTWTSKSYHCFFVDNLEHKCYKVDANRNCIELKMVLHQEDSGYDHISSDSDSEEEFSSDLFESDE